MSKSSVVLACVTAQMSCERIINAAKKMASRMDAELEVITIQPKKQTAENRARDMKCLYNLSRKTGSEIIIYYSDNPVKSIVKHAMDKKVFHIFTGKPDSNNEFVGKLSMVLNHIPISMVTEDIVFTIPAVSGQPAIIV
ncbi:MAG TPA: hypothetical protein GXX17_02170 [Clostridiales bacterium]|nr:hypothetical protein [Clostridiales bacterium]